MGLLKLGGIVAAIVAILGVGTLHLECRPPAPVRVITYERNIYVSSGDRLNLQGSFEGEEPPLENTVHGGRVYVLEEDNILCTYSLATGEKISERPLDPSRRNISRIFSDPQSGQLYAQEWASSERQTSLLRLDMSTNRLNRVPLRDDGFDFSVAAGVIAYATPGDRIWLFRDGTSEELPLKGKHPSLSPDGTRLAFVVWGLFLDRIKIYDVVEHTTMTAATLLCVFQSLGPHMAWSRDGLWLAFHPINDISAPPLHVLDLECGCTTAIEKLRGDVMLTWGFADD